MRKYIHTILCICSVLFLASCGRVEGEIKEEKTEVAQFTADTEKVAEIATEDASGGY